MEALVKFQEKINTKPDGDFGRDTLLKAKAFYKLSDSQTAHFFAQTSHETGEFRLFSENLNYSADGLLKIFPKYFKSNAAALSYARKPEKIANRVYANRMGNGDEASGDGWKYRGRGALQLTGKANYIAFAEFVKDPEVVTNPDLVADKYAFESALFFFAKNKIWSKCLDVSDESIKAVTKIINGGVNGLTDRANKTKKYYALLTSK